jgi:hypothetical protein
MLSRGSFPSCLLAFDLIAWVRSGIDIDLANARATCRFWLDDIPMVRYPHYLHCMPQFCVALFLG